MAKAMLDAQARRRARITRSRWSRETQAAPGGRAEEKVRERARPLRTPPRRFVARALPISSPKWERRQVSKSAAASESTKAARRLGAALILEPNRSDREHRSDFRQ
jgi:hypothetical protein